MEISKTKLLTLITITFLCASVVGYALHSSSLQRRPKLRVNVYMLHESVSGKHLEKSGNLITDIGERYVRNILGFDNVTDHNATKWISLSNDATPLVTWTKLPNEITTDNGFRRALATMTTWMNGTDYAYNASNKFTATGTQQLQCAGANWNPTRDSDNNLFAAATFSQTTFNSGDNCTITWVITWDAN